MVMCVVGGVFCNYHYFLERRMAQAFKTYCVFLTVKLCDSVLGIILVFQKNRRLNIACKKTLVFCGKNVYRFIIMSSWWWREKAGFFLGSSSRNKFNYESVWISEKYVVIMVMMMIVRLDLTWLYIDFGHVACFYSKVE